MWYPQTPRWGFVPMGEVKVSSPCKYPFWAVIVTYLHIRCMYDRFIASRVLTGGSLVTYHLQWGFFHITLTHAKIINTTRRGQDGTLTTRLLCISCWSPRRQSVLWEANTARMFSLTLTPKYVVPNHSCWSSCDNNTGGVLINVQETCLPFVVYSIEDALLYALMEIIIPYRRIVLNELAVRK